MRKLLKIVGWLAGVFIVVIGALVVAVFLSFRGTAPIVDGLEVVTGVRTVKEGFVSCFIVDLGRGKVALIDAGVDRAAKPILAELARRKLGADAVEAILLTHGHSDHTAGCAAFPKAAICALEADVALAEGRAASRSPMGRLAGVRPTGLRVTRVLRDGETVRLGTTAFRVFAVPGHTSGSAAFLVRGALLMGDSADSRKDGRLQGVKWIFSESSAQNRASLKALAGRLGPNEVKMIAFAHSGPLKGLQPLLDFAAKP